MTAIGLELPRETIKDAGKYGSHLLSDPTASELTKYSEKDTIIAGFHTDLSCFTTPDGRSQYPGLHIWARNTGKRIPVRFPLTDRYLLVQARKQIEHLTGGLIKAGFHEVVVNEATVERNAGLAPQIVRSLGYHQPSSGAFLQITALPLF